MTDFTVVHHPHHYTQGQVECIDAMRSMLTPEEFTAYCRAAALKYIWRSPHKGCEQTDLMKAVWYINKALEVM